MHALINTYRPRLRDQMQYCTDHPEEVSKLSRVKAQVDQVKSIMMENIDKVINNQPSIVSCAFISYPILDEGGRGFI